MNSTCVGQASPLGPRRIAAVNGPPDACRARNRARWRVTAGSAAYGSPELLQTRRCRRRAGMSVARDRREESVEQHLIEIGAAKRRANRAADQPAALAEHRDRMLVTVRLREQRLLRDAALVPQRLQLPRCRCGDLSLSRRCCSDARQRQIHVVAAEQDVIADRRRARAPDRRRARSTSDQAEVGRCRRRCRTPARGRRRGSCRRQRSPRAVDPGVAGGLRLLEQRDVRQAGGLRGAQRQLRVPPRRTTPAR